MDAGRSETRLAAVMFSDIVGFSIITVEDHEKGRRIRRQHEELARPLVEQYGGTWIERVGDETLSIYSSAIQAVDCALGN